MAWNQKTIFRTGKKIRIISFIFFQIFLFVILPCFAQFQKAYASTCIYEYTIPPKLLKKADVIFLGKLIDVSGNNVGKNRFKILKPYKGIPKGVHEIDIYLGIDTRFVIEIDEMAPPIVGLVIAKYPQSDTERVRPTVDICTIGYFNGLLGQRLHSYLENRKYIILAGVICFVLLGFIAGFIFRLKSAKNLKINNV